MWLMMDCNHLEEDGTINYLCTSGELKFYPFKLPDYFYLIHCKYCYKELGLVDNREHRHHIYLKSEFSHLLKPITEMYNKRQFKTEIVVFDINSDSMLKEIWELNKERDKPIKLPEVKPLSKSDENHFKLISEVNQDIKKSENIDQVSIINNQALKISDLENEVKRLEKIVIGLSEVLINERKEA